LRQVLELFGERCFIAFTDLDFGLLNMES